MERDSAHSRWTGTPAIPSERTIPRSSRDPPSSIKTVPIAQGDQFEIFPSNNLGMGSVSIALADTLLDPFLNPAKGARLGAARFFGAPTAYGISQGAGGGRTLPLAVSAGAGAWFGAFSLALQQVDASKAPTFNGGGNVVALAPLRVDTAFAPGAVV